MGHTAANRQEKDVKCFCQRDIHGNGIFPEQFARIKYIEFVAVRKAFPRDIPYARSIRHGVAPDFLAAVIRRYGVIGRQDRRISRQFFGRKSLFGISACISDVVCISLGNRFAEYLRGRNRRQRESVRRFCHKPFFFRRPDDLFDGSVHRYLDRIIDYSVIRIFDAEALEVLAFHDKFRRVVRKRPSRFGSPDIQLFL